MRAGIAAIPDGTYRFADRYDNPEIDGELRLSRRDHGRGRRDALHFDAPAAGARRPQHDLHRAAVDRLLRGQDGGRSDDPAECRPGAAAHRHGAARAAWSTAMHPAAVNGRLQTCQRVVDLIHRRAGPGGAGAGDRRVQRRPAPRPPSSASEPDGQVALGLSRDDRRRLRRARRQGRAGRRARAHDQHLEPAGRGAGDRISADACCATSWSTARAAPASIAAAWGCAGSTRRGRLPRAGRRLAPALADLGPAGRRAGRARAGRTPGPGTEFTGDSAVLAAGQWFAIVTPGAGGFGLPARRDPDAVARDLAQGVISRDTAREAYGRQRLG